MDGRPTWTNSDEAGDYVVPNVLSPRDLVFRPDNMDETVPHTSIPRAYGHPFFVHQIYITETSPYKSYPRFKPNI